MADNKLALLAARYPHVVPVDPSLAPSNVQGYFMGGCTDAAVLALIVYSGCCVQNSLSILGSISHRTLPAVTNLDKEVCTT